MFLIIAAVGGEIAATFIQTRGSPKAIPVAMMTVSIEMIVGTIFMMIGMYLAAKSRQIKLGSFATTMFKLCAIAVAPEALRSICSRFRAGSFRFSDGCSRGWSALCSTSR